MTSTTLQRLVFLVLGSFWLGGASLRAGTALGFPKDSPAFTFELPDDMQAEYQADGKLVCTAKDPSLNVKGVFQPLPNIKSDKGLRSALDRLVKLIAPKYITTDLRYLDSFEQDTPSGMHAYTAGAHGWADGQDYMMAFIVFSQAGKYYELIVSGGPDAMTKCNFPHGVRETAKPAS